jgi:membrane fusion protein (multidrug efflux system)
VIGLLFLVKVVFFGSPKEEVKSLAIQKEEGVSKMGVKAFKVGRFNYEDSLNALGTIKGAVEFKLSFEVPGIVNSINYREGEQYEEGALLISLKQDDILLRLKRAQAEHKKSKTGLNMTQDKIDEHEKLFSIGAIPKTTLRKVGLEHESAKYDVEVAKLEVKANESTLEKSNLYAPTDGMIGELNIEEGEIVTPNTFVGSHIQVDYVQAEFGVVEREMNKISLGQKAKVYVDAYPDETFEGTIENISPVVSGTSRTATARVRIENPEGDLLPGMFARIRVLLYSKRNALVIPTDAVIGKDRDTEVFVINPEGDTLMKRGITVGYTRPDYSQIEEGLVEGDLIAITNLEKIQDGMEVKVLEVQEAEI